MAFPYIYMPLFSARPRGNHAYVELEPGYRSLFPRASQVTRNFCRIFIRCLAATVGIGMLVYFFVMRYAYHDPDWENNFAIIWFSIMALGMIGFSFLITSEDDGDLVT